MVGLSVVMRSSSNKLILILQEHFKDTYAVEELGYYMWKNIRVHVPEFSAYNHAPHYPDDINFTNYL